MQKRYSQEFKDNWKPVHNLDISADIGLNAYQTLIEVQAAIGWYINFYNRNRISIITK